MATLSQVYINLAMGTVVTTICYIGFGAAVRFECNKDLTPRAWNRPIQVIKNCLSRPYSLSWIHWAMSQRYIDLLAGIPGTGTRQKGWSGPNLRTNLDGIILMRYHALQFKVSVVTTILCIAMLLPLYYTAECDPLKVGRPRCQEISQNTDFEQLTIANVVPEYSTEIIYKKNGTSVDLSDASIPANYLNSTDLNDIDLLQTISWSWTNGVTERYLAFAFTITLITIYTCYLLWYEWVECLALRRVYYLESEYYEERLEELDDIRSNTDPEDPFQSIRPPYLPHPEMRETIPNVSLHSALYKLPSNLDANFDDTSEKSLLERQLAAGVKFFDQCVPNQPGFTSSIAAITMVPDAQKATKVWGKWYECGSKMRRLRYIKSHLETRLKMQREGELGLRDMVITAPLNAVKATVKATTEKIDTMKVVTSEGFETVKELASEEIEKMKELGRERIPTRMQTNPTQVCSTRKSNSSFVSCSEDEFFDAATFTSGSDNDIENETRDEEKKNGDFETELSLTEGSTKEDSTPSSLTQDNANGTSSRSKTINDSQTSAAPVDIELGQAHCIGESTTLIYHDVDYDAEKGDPESASGNLVTIVSSGEEDQQDDTNNTTNAEAHVLGFNEGTTEHFEYDEFDPEKFAKWIGYSEETELDQLIDTLDIEQLSVYAREMSQSASNPCVYGCGLRSLRLSSIEQLEAMLDDAWSSVREANAELLLARANMFKEEARTSKAFAKKEENGDDNVKNKTKSVRFKRKDSTIDQDDKEMKNELVEEDVPSSIESSISKRPRGLRKRVRVKSTRAKYDEAKNLVDEINAVAKTNPEEEKKSYWFSCLTRGAKKTGRKRTTVLHHPSYAVVTFTSRQAAIAARQCVADGKGTRAWTQVQNIPMTPLADAPPRNIFFCRGCCRPVTLTIPNKEKRIRKILSWVFYITFCTLYTVPLSLVSQVLDPAWLAARYPDNEVFQDPNSFFFKALAGISSGLLYSLFFSILPQIFKALAFFEGTSSSKVKAEEKAMRFYWYFMLVTAFTGSSLVQMLIDGFMKGSVGAEFKDILVTVAASIVTQQAPVWLNWILVRTGTTLPINYLLQFMTFLYGCLKINWLNRVMRGGGPGGPPPYRIYIDSGVVFMCLVSLAPACPIIAPACTLYYMVLIPMLRWLHIFVYRPPFDGGGSKFPVLHEILISSLILGHFLLGVLLLLNQSFLLGLFIICMSVPTYLFSCWTKEKFLRSYEDAGLWQTSMLDGLSDKETIADREKYRRWLVDCHKASYVPICLSGGEDFLTSQPAVVVPLERDIEEESGKISPRRGIMRQSAF